MDSTVSLKRKTDAKVVVSNASDVFNVGKYQVNDYTVKTSDATQPPVEIFIVTPVTSGTYPVLLFFHAFLLDKLTNICYRKLLYHIASHGYIVVAPQFGTNDCEEEVRGAAKLIEWLSKGQLPNVMPENVNPDIENLALSGHSQGGKIAFALALGITDEKQSVTVRDSTAEPPLKFKAVIGIDPVAGSSPSNRPKPIILKYIPRCFNMSTAVAVIGTEYGNQSQGLIPPFAPDGVNHSEFFNESKPPACYFLTKGYGHVDMLDDNWFASLPSVVCKSGPANSRDLMRRSVGGIVVAFLKCYLGHDEDDLNAIVDDPTIAPITLDPVLYVKE